MQACPRCQTENHDDDRSCTKCGAPLDRTTFGRRVTPPGQDAAAGGSRVLSSSSTRFCPSCGQATPANTQFCSACGGALGDRTVGGVEYASFWRRRTAVIIKPILPSLRPANFSHCQILFRMRRSPRRRYAARWRAEF